MRQNPAITLNHLRRFAVSRSLFPPTTLERALDRFAFVQADPIRAPARAQDLILRHRVTGYRSGDLERHYVKLGVEEDFFINYGFVTRQLQALMHPRSGSWVTRRTKHAQFLLNFIRERGAAHPREVDAHFARGSVRNYWGGSSNATTHLLSNMHYSGMLRILRRDAGIRIYATHQHGPEPASTAERHARIDALIDIAVGIYAPLSAPGLASLVRRLRYAVPQWQRDLTAAIQRAKQRLAHLSVDGIDWYWPASEDPLLAEQPETLRLLTPFDPVVWDRARFELLWNWVYRFEAYTPAPKRKLGYYALPLLWRDRVIGWANVSDTAGRLVSDFGFVAGGAPRDRAFKRELAAELANMRSFLGMAL